MNIQQKDYVVSHIYPGGEMLDVQYIGNIVILLQRGEHGKANHMHTDRESASPCDDNLKLFEYGFLVFFYGVYFCLLNRDISYVASLKIASAIRHRHSFIQPHSIEDTTHRNHNDDDVSKHALPMVEDNICCICDDVLDPTHTLEATEEQR
uniref:Uncharacterized protein n=1 Tax=Lygus hesperus TaxID=30085 RepID=A0A146LMJ8_LYGHE